MSTNNRNSNLGKIVGNSHYQGKMYQWIDDEGGHRWGIDQEGNHWFVYRQGMQRHDIPVGVERVLVEDGVTKIEEGAFLCNERPHYLNSALKHVKIAASVEIIQEFAFRGCHNVVSVEIPADSRLESIAYRAFDESSSWCGPLILPESLREADLTGCKSLTKIVGSASTERLQLSGCNNLVELDLSRCLSLGYRHLFGPPHRRSYGLYKKSFKIMAVLFFGGFFLPGKIVLPETENHFIPTKLLPAAVWRLFIDNKHSMFGQYSIELGRDVLAKMPRSRASCIYWFLRPRLEGHRLNELIQLQPETPVKLRRKSQTILGKKRNEAAKRFKRQLDGRL